MSARKEPSLSYMQKLNTTKFRFQITCSMSLFGLSATIANVKYMHYIAHNQKWVNLKEGRLTIPGQETTYYIQLIIPTCLKNIRDRGEGKSRGIRDRREYIYD